VRAKYLVSPWLVLPIWLVACSGKDFQTILPEPRPLGRGYGTPQPLDLTPGVSTANKNEPTGVLSLREALLLALRHSPDLAAFAWEVRAGEARTLQAGLLPNPEFDIELENFAGSGDLEGFDARETTIALNQLIELGGKRLKRKRVAALERDLRGWDYEAKRLDVFTE